MSSANRRERGREMKPLVKRLVMFLALMVNHQNFVDFQFDSSQFLEQWFLVLFDFKINSLAKRTNLGDGQLVISLLLVLQVNLKQMRCCKS